MNLQNMASVANIGRKASFKIRLFARNDSSLIDGNALDGIFPSVFR